MDDGDDFDVDPAIAAAMGFAGFGNQGKGKKRKFGGADAFVEPAPGSSDQRQKKVNDKSGRKNKQMDQGATGSNAVALGKTSISHATTPATASATASDALRQATGPATISENTTETVWTREALRLGVRNANGDMVYFLPSFIDPDPWKHLRGKEDKGEV